MIQQKSKPAFEEQHFLMIKKEVSSVLAQVSTQRKEKEEQLNTIIQNAKNAMTRNINKVYKKFSNDLSTQFDSLVHNLNQLVSELDANKDLKVFRLESMLRYAHKVSGEAKKIDIDKLEERMEKLCKGFADSSKDLEPIKKVNTELNEQCSLVFRKSYQFHEELKNVGYVNSKFFVQGPEFYKIEGKQKQARKESINLTKTIRIYSQEYILSAYDDYIRIQNSKGVRMAKIDGDFYGIVNVVQIGDILFAVCMTSITKIDVHSGACTTKNIYKGEVTGVADKDYCGFLVILMDSELRLYNTQCQLMNSRKLTMSVIGVAVASNKYIAVWSEGNIVLLQNLETVFKKEIKNIKGVCNLNINELLVISNSSRLISLLTLQTNPITFNDTSKKEILRCVSNSHEVHLLYSNNTVKEFCVD